MKPDGLRGPFGRFDISEDYFYRLPGALKTVLGIQRVSIGHDPRVSSQALYEALIAGARSVGLEIILLGMMPTPMVAKWVHDKGGVGLMVTASHNQALDNGVKFIGFMIPDQRMQAMKDALAQKVTVGVKSVPIDKQIEAKDHYLFQLQKNTGRKSQRCLLDSAYGAWHFHLDVWRSLGFTIDLYQDDYHPDKINTTGSVGMENRVYPKGYDYVIAVDGDGDRLQLFHNDWMDGDDILLHLSQDKKDIVGTIMSNRGMDDYCQSHNIRFFRSSVGDQNLKEMMVRKKLRYGAEPCGHVLDLNWMGYSDPCYLFSHLLDLGEVRNRFKKHYQYHFVLPDTLDVDEIKQLFSHPKIHTLVRQSNTEPVIRVMLEGDALLIKQLIKDQALNSASILEKKEG